MNKEEKLNNIINSNNVLNAQNDINASNNLVLNTDVIGANIIHYKEIDSTQKEIWRRIESGKIQNGTLIMADIQTEAIGTHGRTWYTTENNNIAFSFVLYPNTPVSKLDKLTTQIAKIIMEVFNELYKINLKIKLPNDIVLETKQGIRKLGGILTQTKLQGEIVKYLVIGIGINTNQEQFEEEIKDIATSIKNEFGIDVNNNDVISMFCEKFEKIAPYLCGKGQKRRKITK